MGCGSLKRFCVVQRTFIYTYHILNLFGFIHQVDAQELLDGDMNTSLTSSTFSTDSLENLVVNLDFPAYKDRLQQTFNDNIRVAMKFLEETGKCGEH